MRNPFAHRHNARVPFLETHSAVDSTEGNPLICDMCWDRRDKGRRRGELAKVGSIKRCLRVSSTRLWSQVAGVEPRRALIVGNAEPSHKRPTNGTCVGSSSYLIRFIGP